MRRFLRRSTATVFAIAVGTTLCATARAAAQDDLLAEGLVPAKVDVNGLRGKLSPRLDTARGRATANS
ncbi:MAG TPA: hypothetical protein VFG87_10480 [Amycolatopsis sp.]|jgi:hypothetical protein|nr:hypothetical protein [Amycolatopsis sp.]